MLSRLLITVAALLILSACQLSPRAYAERVCAERGVAGASPGFAQCVADEQSKFERENQSGNPMKKVN